MDTVTVETFAEIIIVDSNTSNVVEVLTSSSEIVIVDSGASVFLDIYEGLPGPQGPQGPTGATGPAGTTDHLLLTNIGTNTHVQIDSHIANTSNPHGVTKTQVGLGNCDNTSDANKPISLATQTALNAKENSITSGTTSQYWRGDKTFQTLDKNAVGLNNVDNVSDVNKPVSTAQAAADAVVQNYAIQRANHTGTQLSSTISDFTEAAQDSVSTSLTNTTTINFSYNDLSNQITANVNASSITDSLLSTGINANKIGTGTVSNTEFEYLDGATSSIQTQINGKYNNPLGLASQYIKGDGTFASFPSSQGGGGGGAVYYLNGGISQGTISGTTYYQLSTAANTGPTANFNTTGNGLLAAFITDIGSPNLPLIPAGIWIFQICLSESFSGAPFPEVYALIQKYDGTTFTTIATSIIEQVTNGTVKDLYTFSVTIPTSTFIATTDRVVIKLFTSNATGRTVTLYTQDANTSAVQTTFSTGIASINGLTESSQYFGIGTSGSDFSISSTADTHTFNLPSASATKRGLLTSGDWTAFSNKEPAVASGTTSQYYRGDKTFQTLDKAAVGLGNVDNTSDANKPVSTAQSTALSLKVDKAGDTMTGPLRIIFNESGAGPTTSHIVFGDAGLGTNASLSMNNNGQGVQIFGGSTPTTGGGIYTYGNSSGDSPGSVQFTLGKSSAEFGLYDHTQSINLIRSDDSGNFTALASVTAPIVNVSSATASRVAVLDASKNVTSSSVSTTTLGYLDATSSVQTQIDSKTDNTQSIINALIFG